jgi:YesN/AraC family two-component response regulator
MDEKIVKIAQRFIEAHYCDIQHLEDIAEHLACNYNSLRYYFARYTGMTLGQYLNKIRCRRACELLDKTDWKLYRIACEVGFHDDKYFIKVFEKHFGTPPNQFRQHLHI